jgi:hypothetical protein
MSDKPPRTDPEYMRRYMAERRERLAKPGTLQATRRALRQIVSELAESGTEKGKRLHRLAVEALGGDNA